MSRQGPSGSGSICCTTSLPTSTERRSGGHALLGSAVGSPGLATVITIAHCSGPLFTRWVISCSSTSGPPFASSSGCTVTGCAAGTSDQRTMLVAPEALVKVKLLRLLNRSSAKLPVQGALCAQAPKVASSAWAATKFFMAFGSLLPDATVSAYKASGVETGKKGASIMAERHTCPSDAVIWSPIPRTRTVASGALRLGEARLNRPTIGYCPRRNTGALERLEPAPL